MLGQDGVANKMFLTILFSNKEVARIVPKERMASSSRLQ
jgi:hypothetical protein